jgi:putative ABC transport system permease protein
VNLLLTLRVALRALAKNKMRAGLTVLGVVIGIAAVTTMVSIGESATSLVQGSLQGLGTNVIFVIPGSTRTGGVRDNTVPTLTAGDSDAIARECASVLATSPIVGFGGQVIYGNSNAKPKQCFGVGSDYLIVRNWQIISGGFFTDRDMNSAAKVCVIGQSLATKLFQTSNALDETIRLKNVPLRVIGVLERKGANIVGDDQDDIILLPYTTMKKRIQGSNFDNVNAIMASARTLGQMGDAGSEIRQLLMERHRLQPGQQLDFQVQNTIEIANQLSVITGAITLMLSAIAAISLVVGGVGIMNIMLVSVTERTREIGIRMAVGARGKDILRQFLVEAILLSGFGGIIGIGLGFLASVGLVAVINSVSSGSKWPTVISVPAAMVALLFAAAVGLFFGFYPARRASKLDPIDALRYE